MRLAVPVFRSIRTRVLALTLFCVAGSLAISLGVIALAPPIAPETATIGEMLGAYAARDARGDWDYHIANAPPPSTGSQLSGMIAASIAEGLGIAPAQVRVEMLRETVFGLRPLSEQELAGRITFLEVSPGAAAPLSQGGAASLPTLLRAAPIELPPFRAAIAQPDGSWALLSPRRSIPSPWHVRLLIVFAGAVLMTVPLAWWSAHRLTTPIRRLADVMENFSVARGYAPAPVEGSTETRSAAAAFNRLQERLLGYVAERTTMLAAIAHDLRTPLTSLRVWAEEAPPVARVPMMRDIARMNAMIDQILIFSRADHGSREHKPVEFGAVVREAVRRAREAGGPIALETHASARVMGDPVELARLLDNLIDNAVKFGGKAEVALTREEDILLLQVRDNGPGVPPEAVEKLFEPFFRLENSRSRDTGGAGLGLSIARSIVAAHRGSISLRNRSEGGLEALVTLPVVNAP